MRRALTTGAAVALACCAALPAAAAQAAAPGATTVAASDVAATGATLNARVAPNKTSTTYRFQYGTTTAYGSETAAGGPVAGNGTKTVATAVSGLTPATTYHFRVVATNASGTATGADLAFTTLAPGAPGSGITAAANPATVTFGKPVAISGVVAGGAGEDVTLQQSPFPYTGPFGNVAEATADATGAYSFSVAPGANTRYRVRGKGNAASGEVQVLVRAKVKLRLSDRTPQRGQRIRLRGAVLPAHDGRTVKLQRRRSGGGWRTIATPALTAAAPIAGVTRSKYSKRVRVRRDSTYRAVFVPGDGDHERGRSARRSAVVH